MRTKPLKEIIPLLIYISGLVGLMNLSCVIAGDSWITTGPIDYDSMSGVHVLDMPEPSGDLEAEIKLQELEGLPSEQDPGGNWGETREGLQMGLRLLSFTAKQRSSFSAALLLRNVSTEPRIFYSALMQPAGLCLKVTRDGKELSQKMLENSGGSFVAQEDKAIALEPRTQWRYGLSLGEMYDMSQPGEYTVTASCKVPNQNNFTEMLEITTSVATLVVSNSQKTNSPSSGSSLASDTAAMVRNKGIGGPQRNITITPKTTKAPTVENNSAENMNSPPASEGAGRGKIIWGTLSFLAFLLGVIFYRAHQRTLYQNKVPSR